MGLQAAPSQETLFGSLGRPNLGISNSPHTARRTIFIIITTKRFANNSTWLILYRTLLKWRRPLSVTYSPRRFSVERICAQKVERISWTNWISVELSWKTNFSWTNLRAICANLVQELNFKVENFWRWNCYRKIFYIKIGTFSYPQTIPMGSGRALIVVWWNKAL